VLEWDVNTASLQSSPFLNGDFTEVIGATSPYTFDTTTDNGFFRLVAKWRMDIRGALIG